MFSLLPGLAGWLNVSAGLPLLARTLKVIISSIDQLLLWTMIAINRTFFSIPFLISPLSGGGAAEFIAEPWEETIASSIYYVHVNLARKMTITGRRCLRWAAGAWHTGRG